MRDVWILAGKHLIRGREASAIADWQNRGWEIHAQDKGALRTTLTLRPSRHAVKIQAVDGYRGPARRVGARHYALSKAFARTYKGRTIEFDGSIANAMGSTYLVYAGDNSDTDYVPGPAFQFRGLEVDGGRARAGDNMRFVATVGTFKVSQGLFSLTSVSAKPR